VAGFGIVTPALLSAGGVVVPVLVPGSDGGSVLWPSAPGTVSVGPSGTVVAGTVPVPGLGSVPAPPGAGRALPPMPRAGVAGALDDGDVADDPSLRWPRSARRCARRRTDRDIVPAAPAGDVDVDVDPADPAVDPSSPARTIKTAASASSAPVTKKRSWRRSTTFSQRV
jgi:hypothetical protein